MVDLVNDLKLHDGECFVSGIYTANNLKSGRIATTISYLTCYEDWRGERGLRCDGIKVGNEFTYIDCSDLRVGDVVRFVYRKGFQDKAELAGYTVIRSCVE